MPNMLQLGPNLEALALNSMCCARTAALQGETKAIVSGLHSFVQQLMHDVPADTYFLNAYEGKLALQSVNDSKCRYEMFVVSTWYCEAVQNN